MVLGARRRMGPRLGRLALWRRYYRLGAAAAGRSDRRLRRAAGLLAVRAAALYRRAAAAHALPAARPPCVHAARNTRDQSAGACRRPAALGQSGPRPGFHRRPHARGAACLQRAPARVRRHDRRARRGGRAPAGPAHQGRGQARGADHHPAHHRRDQSGRLDAARPSRSARANTGSSAVIRRAPRKVALAPARRQPKTPAVTTPATPRSSDA